MRRYRRPKPRKLTPINAKKRWETFRIVKVAIRTLRQRGMPVTSRTVTDMTLELATTMDGFRRVPEKTMLNNDLCFCIYEAWTTAKPSRRSIARPTMHIPRSLKKKSAAELRLMVVELKAKFEKERSGRLAAIAAQGSRPTQADAQARRLAIIRAAAEAALATDASFDLATEGASPI